MKDDTRSASDPLITGAEIARLAGVTRAAVANWRRRYDDFPAPAGGGTNSPLFHLTEVRAWLAKQRKGHDVSDEVRLWQSLRGAYGDDLIQGLAAVARLLADGTPPPGLAPEITQQTMEIAGNTSNTELIAALGERFLDSTRRAGSDQVTSPRIVQAVQHFAGPVPKTASILDPACGIGTLLLCLGPASGPTRHGQEVGPAMADFAQLRATLSGRTPTDVRAGDSLRDDQWPDLKADLVICDPPVASPDWGREDLLLDQRWELGTPSRAEGELAWLQHAYAHTAPGGRTILVMPASVAYRKAGRRIRAELVRRGILVQVVALPPGTATAHSLPVHLWFLRRPNPDGVQAVQMVDLTTNSPDGPLDPEPDQAVDVPLIDLLDDTVDLTPGTHVRGTHRDYLTEYATLRSQLQDQLHALEALLPQLAPGGGPGTLDNASVSVADLARAGLVEYTDGDPASASDHLDTDYLHGFLLSPANKRRSTSTSGAFRVDARGSRIPQMGIQEQRRYGAAFRALQEFEERTRQLARLSGQATALAREGLTNGALNPPPEGA
ncbi:N-6 DNA methylase [Actinacidiphila oryziradicis]|uniref:SAM-dependent methyltransferase n=1 Tax=Actinacidiphila oryziradicis TaxID=2571141 RepID=A0A4U0STV4_9ACTN|nr:N-6 DNA methylase [Actinacidiphila oryziradicis]TKA11921.1 SAM-dependent methyltransferase [Actinacidiphila oryziradicis]